VHGIAVDPQTRRVFVTPSAIAQRQEQRWDHEAQEAHEARKENIFFFVRVFVFSWLHS